MELPEQVATLQKSNDDLKSQVSALADTVAKLQTAPATSAPLASDGTARSAFVADFILKKWFGHEVTSANEEFDRLNPAPVDSAVVGSMGTASST